MFDSVLLAQLREASFTPGAWRRFLAAMPGQVKRNALDNPAAVRSLLIGGLLLLVLLFLGSLFTSILYSKSFGIRMLATASAWLVGTVGWQFLHIGLLRYPSGLPASSVGLANWITTARVMAVPILYLCITEHLVAAFVIGYLLWGAADFADGFVARRTGLETRLGIVLDPLADVVLTTAVFLALWRTGVFPWYLFAMLMARYGLLLGGAVYLYVYRGHVKIRPTTLGKLTGLLTVWFVVIAVAARELFTPSYDGVVLMLAVHALTLVVATTVVQVAAIGWMNLRGYERSERRLTRVAGG